MINFIKKSLFYLLFATAVFAEDYQKLLQEFQELGLPDVSNASYVRIQRHYWDREIISSILDDNFTTLGNGWLLGSDKAGISQCIVSGNHYLNLKEGDKATHHLNNNKVVIEEVSLETDIKRVIRYLKRNPKLSYPVRDYRIFFFALNIMQKGEIDKGVKIIELLNRKDVVNKAKSNLAKTQYNEAITRFNLHKDFMLLLEDLEELLTRYDKETCKAYSGIKQLKKNIFANFKNGKQDPIIFENLTPSEKVLAKALLVSKRNNQRNTLKIIKETPSVIWLIPETWTPKFPNYKDDPILHILSKGKEALPLLLQLYDDKETLTPYAEVKWSEQKSYLNYNSHDSILKDLSRPLTLRDLSYKILDAMIPKRNGASRKSPIPEARRIISDFSDKNQAELISELKSDYEPYSPNPILQNYLIAEAKKQPNFNYEETILLNIEEKVVEPVDELFTNKNQRDLPFYKIERFVVFAFRYAQARRNKEIVRRLSNYCQRLSKDYAYQQYSNSNSEGNPKYINESKQKFKALVKEMQNTDLESFEKQLLSYLNKNQDDIYKFPPVISCTDDLDKAMQIISKQTDTTTVLKGLRFLFRYRNKKNKFYPFIKPPSVKKYKDFWEKILNNRDFNGKFHVGLTALIDMETIYAPDDIFKDHTFSNSNTLLPDKNQFIKIFVKSDKFAFSILSKRATERMEGVPESELSPLPFEKRVKVNESETIQQLHQYGATAVESFDIYQKNKLQEILIKYPKLNKDLLREANVLTDIDVQVDDLELNKSFKPFINLQVDSHLISKMQQVCKQYAIVEKPIHLILKRRKQFGGCKLTIKTAKISERESGVDGYFGQVCFHDTYSDVEKRTSPNGKKNYVKTSPETEQKTFKTAIINFTENSEASSPAVIRFITKGDRR